MQHEKPSFEYELQKNDNKTEEELSRETLPEKVEAVIVLGKNWRAYPPKNASEEWQLHLSIESKMSALAAGEMFKEGLTDKIIFSGGRTAGKDRSSEAKAMWDYLKKKYPDIPDKIIALEEESLDTAGNAEEVLKILQQYNIQDVALMTAGFHLPRAKKLFKEFGIETQGVPSEELLKKRSKHYERFVEKYLESGQVKTKGIKEMILRTLLFIDAKGKLPRLLTKKFRHGK